MLALELSCAVMKVLHTGSIRNNFVALAKALQEERHPN